MEFMDYEEKERLAYRLYRRRNKLYKKYPNITEHEEIKKIHEELKQISDDFEALIGVGFEKFFLLASTIQHFDEWDKKNK